MDDIQLDIFSMITKDPIENPCCVIMDGQCQDLTWADLFDINAYDELKCVTYVSSGSFYEKAAGKFEKVQIIIGIEKGSVKRAFAESIRSRMNNEGTRFFEKLPEKAKQRIINRELEFRYSTPDSIIHSKFYLLVNSETGENRLIVGSANLTESAFSNNVRQYEDVLAFNNSPLFEIYQKRFEAIYRNTIDYIPEETIERYREGRMISVADFTAEEKTEDLLRTLKEANIVPVINEAVLQQIQEEQDLAEREHTEVRATYEVISVTTKKDRKTGNFVIKAPKELENVKTRIIDILFKGTKQEQSLSRFTLSFNDADKKQYRIYPAGDGEESGRAAEVYDRKATTEEITAAMTNLNQFIAAYQYFVSSPDNENLSHIFETILYAFTSAYIFKLRQVTSSSRRTDIPIMLIIGGRAASGKSSLLAYIDALLSGRQLSREEHYLQYEKLTGKTLPALFGSENTYPLLVDEVAPSFFNSKAAGKGEALIKYLSNTLTGKHPVMICTTNTDTFNIPAQVARRVYYVQVDACFDETKRAESSDYYENVLANATNLLFRDFCYRMDDLIVHDDLLFGDDTADYLYCARKLFQTYYEEAGMEVPKFLPQNLYQDYVNRGREMWKILFRQTQESFTYNESGKTDEPELIVNLKEIASGSNKDLTVYMNYLQQDLLVEAAGIYTILKAESFFNWIGVENPWRKKSLFQRLFGVKK